MPLGVSKRGRPSSSLPLSSLSQAFFPRSMRLPMSSFLPITLTSGIAIEIAALSEEQALQPRGLRYNFLDLIISFHLRIESIYLSFSIFICLFLFCCEPILFTAQLLFTLQVQSHFLSHLRGFFPSILLSSVLAFFLLNL